MMTTERVTDFRKVIRVGTLPELGRQESVYCKVEFKSGRLSISGVVGPMKNGNSRGSCGQIIMGFKEYDHRGRASLGDLTPAPGWTAEMVRRFFDAWNRWHLNDMKAGSPAQEEHLRANPVSYKYPESHYDAARKSLAAAGLDPDPADGYRYGSAWRSEAVPDDVLDFLRDLPNTDNTPAWV